jgi:hypothetical protein
VDEQAVAITTTQAQQQERQIDSSKSVEAFLAELLRWQCELVGATAGVVYLRPNRERQDGIASTWGPNGGAAMLADANLQRYQRLGARTVQQDETIVEEFDAGEGLYTGAASHRVISCPLRSADMTHGAVIVLVSASLAPAATRDAIVKLDLSSRRFEAFMWRQQCMVEAKAKVQLRETLELLDAAQQGVNAETMGQLFCNELERRFGCTRVSIGLVKGQAIKMVSVGNTDDLKKYSAVAESLEGVMEECADQDVEILYPQPLQEDGTIDPGERRVTYAHSQHSEKFGPVALASLPLRVSNDLVGVVVMEREQADPFPPGALPLLRLVAEYIGPAMWTRRLADRNVLAVSRDRFYELGEKLVGPRHTTLKLVVAAILLVFLLMVVVPVPNRVVADGTLKAMAARQIPAPYSALLDEVRVKPGDVVAAGQVLGKLDTLELEHERSKALAQLAGLERQRDKALAEGKLADAKMAQERINEANAMIAIFDDRLQRSTLTAPIDGVVTQGDLEEYINAPVEPSQVLFEVMDLSNLRVLIEVDERDIHRVKVGDEGRFTPAGSPGRRVPFEVTALVPAAEPREAKNIYRLEAVLENPEDIQYLRPGMAGTARINDGYSNTFGILTRRAADAIRMRLWW